MGTNPLNGHDAQLVNSWGLTRGAGGPWWISDNGTGLATVYNGIGNKALSVTIPVAPGGSTPSAPTGVVANGTADFALPGSTAAKFIFVTEQGVIAGWNGGATAVIVKYNSKKGPSTKAAQSPNGIAITTFTSPISTAAKSRFTILRTCL